MKNTLETRLGIFVALAVLAAVLILEFVGGIERFQRGYRLYALFDNVQDLKVGDRVKMAGVEVGRVEDITPRRKDNKVEVTMKLRHRRQVQDRQHRHDQVHRPDGPEFRLRWTSARPRAASPNEGTISAPPNSPTSAP